MSKRIADGSLHLPLTPLIDCTFLLIIFFLLTAQLAGRELPELALASPREPSPSILPAEDKQRNYVTVNVITRYDGAVRNRDPGLSGMASRYQVGVDVVEAGRPDAMAVLTELLGSRKSQADSRGVTDFRVEIRADRDVRYGDVEPVMRAASDAGIEMMSLTAKIENGTPERELEELQGD